jgi:hypothetical protein
MVSFAAVLVMILVNLIKLPGKSSQQEDTAVTSQAETL